MNQQVIELAALVAAIATIGGAWKFIKPRIIKHYLTWKTIGNIHEHFGKDAGKILKSLIASLEGKISLSEVRQALKESRIGLGIFVADTEGQFILANEPLCEMFEMEKDGMLGFGWLTPVLGRDEVFREWQLTFEKHLPYRAQYRIRKNDGTIFYVRSEAVAVRAGGGGPVLYYVGCIERLTLTEEAQILAGDPRSLDSSEGGL